MVLFSRRPRLRGILLAIVGVITLSSTADAQTITPSQPSQVGFHGGVSIDPEQGFGGVWWQTPAIGNRFHLRPGIDGSFGGDFRLGTINIDFLARFPLGNSGWDLIQGAGPVIVIAREPVFDDTDISAGGSYVIGFAHERGFFTEFRVGGGNVPNLKMGIGYGLRF